MLKILIGNGHFERLDGYNKLDIDNLCIGNEY